MAPLLKNIFIDATHDSNPRGYARNTSIKNPMYLPVAVNSFNIRNDAGELINFPHGAITTITLHFEKYKHK